MAFCDYEHCAACVDESEQRSAARRRGETLPDNLPDLVGYKGIYVGNDEVKKGVNVICDRHLDTLRSDLARAERTRDEVGIQYAAAQAVIARMQPVVDAARLVVPRWLGSDLGIRTLQPLNDALARLDTVPGDALARSEAALEVHYGPRLPPTSPAGASTRFSTTSLECACGALAQVNDGDDHLGPPVCHRCWSAGASGQPSGSTPAVLSVTSSDSGVEGNRCGPSGTRSEPSGLRAIAVSHLEALGIDTSNVKVCRCFTICCCDDNGNWSEEIASNVKGW